MEMEMILMKNSFEMFLNGFWDVFLWENIFEKVFVNILYLEMGRAVYQDVDWECCNCTQNGWGQAR